jgi:hypothetical protein
MISFSLEYDVRPWTTNAERAGNRWERAKKTKEWREAFCFLALQARPPRLDWCEITIEPWLKNRSGMQDTGSCHPAAKAAIDGLVDAGVLTDDTPDIVRKLTFVAPQIGRNGLVLLVKGKTA